MPRCDLRVHSRHSNRPTNFFLRQLKAPESLSDPEALYALAKRRGMDFFTLTDSDTITGCLELAHHADVFPSCETMVAFPEDDCKIKLLLFDLAEQQLERVLRLRGHLYNVRDYLCAENIVHAVAAPLDILNSRLAPEHVERMLLLFDLFETRSGGKRVRANEFITDLLDYLTPEFIERVHRKWGIEPSSDKPWQKGCLGGSNDYCGQYVGLTWTEGRGAATPAEFLAELRQRTSSAGGAHGSTLSAAHSIYRVALQYYQQNVHQGRARRSDLVQMILTRVLLPDSPHHFSVTQWMRAGAAAIPSLLSVRRRRSLVERRLIREFAVAYQEIPAGQRLTDVPHLDVAEFDERLFSLVDRVVSRVSFRLLRQAAREFRRGRLGNALSLAGATLPLQTILGPYLHAFDRLNRDRPLISRLEAHFSPHLDLPRGQRGKSKKVAWFSDTMNDVNGVSLTLNKMAEVAEREGADLTIISSVVAPKASRGSRFVNFEPVGEIPVPDYELQKLAAPPVLQMVRYLETAGFTEYVISTPGPVGLTALLAARLLHVPCRAIYHNDFPQHVRLITGDENLEQTTWTYMRWFYGKADATYAPSGFYRDQLLDHGFPADRLRLFHRGTDADRFAPHHRDEHFFEPWGIRNKVILLYVGRMSREKNLDLILDAFLKDADLTQRAALAMVGDGPYLGELKARYAHPSIAFCGFLSGKPLAKAYASADVFLFPSTTDTYGNSVLEAQASGLPALVSAEGGPQEIILPDETGYVLPGHDAARWSTAMHMLAFDAERRARMSSAARAHAATRDWTTAFLEFWNDPLPVSSPRTNETSVSSHASSQSPHVRP
jgi:glycosyltransferase involved in cell wall biosynthesis